MLDTPSKPEIRTDPLAGRRPLEGRTAIVTGSTSGIGLGIATALAQAGAAVMLNGFGDPREIEAQRARIATRTMSMSPTTAPTCPAATPSS